ncbi:MAG: ABC transporter permease subunit [Spirochaetes bacterium]|nr:ABC transporter permease subunit [Spirochaetota bacterium]MBU1080128.1 ABC transporter permease subunit [Spirochaetota bacterium]
MFTKDKLLKFLLAIAVFAAVDLWVYSTVRSSLRANAAETRRNALVLLARSAPEDAGLRDDWLASIADSLPGGAAVYLIPDAEDPSAYEAIAVDEAALELWNGIASTDDAAKGLESAYYFENYASSVKATLSDTPVRLFYAPVTDDAQSELLGIAVFMAPETADSGLERLLTLFALGVFALFAAMTGVSRFSRDSTIGYAVLVLSGLAVVFIVFPLVEAFRLSFLTDGEYSLAIWTDALSGAHLQSLWGSIRLGIWTATASTLVGFLFAFVIYRTSARGKKFLSAIAQMPVISPPFSLTLSILLLAGNNGLITKQLLGLESFSIYGLGGLVLVQTIGMFPIAYLTLASVLQGLDATLEEAALDLNASRWSVFRTVTLPLAVPGILSAWLLVFTSSLADFANPLLLAGNYRVLSVEAYIQVTGRNDLGGGAALSLLLLLPTLTAFFVQRNWVSKRSFVTVTGKPNLKLVEIASPAVRIAMTAGVWLVIAFVLSLYGTIVAGCFVKNWGIDYSFTLSNIGEALSRGKDAIRSTLSLAVMATPIAGLIAMASAMIFVRKTFAGKRVLEAVMMTPFAIPGTLLGIAYILAFNKTPFLLVGTGAIIVINYIVRELPVGIEGGVASLRQIDPSIEEAARDLGADEGMVFKSIVLPLVRPAFISSMSYTFVRSMTAVSAVIFLISARWYHMTVLIYNFSENLRFGLASVLATTLIIIVMGAFGLMRLLVRDTGAFDKTLSR